MFSLHSDEAGQLARGNVLDTREELALQLAVESGVTPEKSCQFVPSLVAGQVRIPLRRAHCKDVAL